MTFPEKYKWECNDYQTWKTFVKTSKTHVSGLHDLNGFGSTTDIDPKEMRFVHYRMERYGRPKERCKYNPDPYEKYGKKITL